MRNKSELTDVAEVFVSLGTTLNMGDYESFKLSVGITYPCRTKDVDKTIDMLYKKIEKELDKRIKTLRK